MESLALTRSRVTRRSACEKGSASCGYPVPCISMNTAGSAAAIARLAHVPISVILGPLLLLFCFSSTKSYSSSRCAGLTSSSAKPRLQTTWCRDGKLTSLSGCIISVSLDLSQDENRDGTCPMASVCCTYCEVIRQFKVRVALQS